MRETPIYRHSASCIHLTESLLGKPIDQETIAEIVKPFAKLLGIADPRAKDYLAYIVPDYLPASVESIRRNSHMNRVSKETHHIDQSVVDAVLVDFANHTSMPLDLAMYTRDLYQ